MSSSTPSLRSSSSYTTPPIPGSASSTGAAANGNAACNVYMEELMEDGLARAAACPYCSVVVARHSRFPPAPPPPPPAAHPPSPHPHDDEDDDAAHAGGHGLTERHRWTTAIMKQKDAFPQWKPNSSVPHQYLKGCEQMVDSTGVPQQYWSFVLLYTQPTESTNEREWIKRNIVDLGLTWKEACTMFTRHFEQVDYTLTLKKEYKRCRMDKTETVQAYVLS